jgi:Ca-activated chloride channel homolog
MVATVLRHRRTTRLGWIAAAACAAIILVGAGVVFLRSAGGGGGGCTGGPVQVTIVASPDHAPVMSRLAQQWSASAPAVDGQCVGATVRGIAPDVVSGSLGFGWDEARNGKRPDVWAPDFGAWLTAAAGQPEAAAVLPDGVPESLATSPVVIAMQRPMAEALGWPKKPLGWTDLIGAFSQGKGWEQFGHPEWGQMRIGVPDPARSTAGLVAVLTFLDPDNDKTMNNQELISGLLLSQLVTNGDDPAKLLKAFAAPGAAEKAQTMVAAFPALERDLAEYAAQKPTVPLVPVYAKEGTAYADYPYAILKAPWVDQTRQKAAGDFLRYLRGPAGKEAYEAAGYRDAAHGTQDPTLLSPDRGFALTVATPQRSATGEQLLQQVGMWTVMQRPNNALLMLDISGSMNDPVPGTSGTRLQLVQKAAIAGSALLNNQTSIGLWVFATKLTPTTDYRELVPPGRAGDNLGGFTRRQAIAGAVTKLRATGGTGLYDSVLAGYQRMLRAWRPNAQNVLVVMTDGKNEDDAGLTLDQLTARLRAVARPDRPLPVLGIAVGPQADAASLQAISKVTGGRTIVARDDVSAIQQLVLAFAGRTA